MQRQMEGIERAKRKHYDPEAQLNNASGASGATAGGEFGDPEEDPNDLNEEQNSSKAKKSSVLDSPNRSQSENAGTQQ